MTDPVADTSSAIGAAGAQMLTPARLAGGFSWPECPRWHEGEFWFSDMYNSVIRVLGEDGSTRIAIDATGRREGSDVPIVLGGFGWLPDGRLIVTSMHEQVLLVHGGGAPDDLRVYADVSDHALKAINDMVVDSDGRAYVTQLGFDLFAGEAPATSDLIVVEPDGTSHVPAAVGPLHCGNGIAISADGTRLYIAEVMANRITVADRAADGTLSDPRLFAACPFLPDGISLDEEGGVWAAMPGSGHVARFTEDGMTHAVEVPIESGVASACLLGGPGRSTLYLTVGKEVYDFERSAREGLGSLWAVEVPFSGGATRP